MSTDVYTAIVTGLFLIAASFAARQAYLNKRLGDKAGAEGAAIGAKTPAEVESISVTTMSKALQAATQRAEIAETALREEREGRRQDREEHRAEMAAMDERLQKLQRQLTELQHELAQRMARLTADD